MGECPAKRLVANMAPAALAYMRYFRKSGEHITFSSLKQVKTRGIDTCTKDVPKLSTWLSHLVDNSICFPHSYPQYVDNLAFFDFLIHSEPIRACRVSSTPAMRRILDNLSTILFVKWHRYYGFSRYTTHRRAGEAWRRAILGTTA